MLKQRLLRYALGFALTIVFILYAGGHFQIPFIKALENQAYDFRLRLALPEKVDKKVVIIDIDEKSLEAIGQWPWDRNIIAKLVDNLFDYYKINVMGFDIVFAEIDEDPSDQIIEDIARSSLANTPEFQTIYAKAQTTLHRDQHLARSLKNRNTVMGIVFDQLDTSLKKGKLPENIPQFAPNSIDDFPRLPRAAGYTANIDILQDHALTGGYFDNPLLDDDGVFRRVPLLQVYDNRIYQSLALAVARASLRNDTLQIPVQTYDEAGEIKSIEIIYIGDIAIPVDESSAVLVPYIGRQGSFNYISAVDVLNKTLPVDAITNKIALFGASAAGLRDLRTTPIQTAFPGVEVHANIIQGILDQTVKHKPEYIIGVEIALLFVFGLVLTFILPSLSPLWSSLSLSAALGIIFFINTHAWNNWQIVLPMASPLLLIVLLYILNMTYGFFVESRGKRQLTHLFGQYVPPELVDEMSKNLTKINLDGEIREMTVLFTDVRNFTTISENMEPKELTRFINSFLTPLTQVIHQNRGTIDKYMGDAIMAFWGAPLEDSQHARHALTAGIEMLKATQAMRDEFSKLGWPEIRIGVGINTGPMNVGNKGSEFRVDYTVLGDAVNLGSRLEGLTKNYGVEIITSEATRHAVPEFEYRELDLVRVKGKDKPVRIFEPIDLVDKIDKTMRNNIKKFHHSLSLYRSQKWDDAEKELFALSQIEPDRKIYRIYLDRIAFFRNKPPGENWDGAFTHTSK